MADQVVSSLGIDVNDFIAPMQEVNDVLAAVDKRMKSFGGTTATFDKNLDALTVTVKTQIDAFRTLSETFRRTFDDKGVPQGIEKVGTSLKNTAKQYQAVNQDVKDLGESLMTLSKRQGDYVSKASKPTFIEQFTSPTALKQGTSEELVRAQKAAASYNTTLQHLISTQQITAAEAQDVAKAFAAGDMGKMADERFAPLIDSLNNVKKNISNIGADFRSGIAKAFSPDSGDLAGARRKLDTVFSGIFPKGVPAEQQANIDSAITKVVDKYETLNNISLDRFKQIVDSAYGTAANSFQGMEGVLFKYARTAIEQLEKANAAIEQHAVLMKNLSTGGQKISGLVGAPPVLGSDVDIGKAEKLRRAWTNAIEDINTHVIKGKFDDTEIQKAIAASKASVTDFFNNYDRRIRELADKFKVTNNLVHDFTTAINQAAAAANKGVGAATPFGGSTQGIASQLQGMIQSKLNVPLKDLKVADFKRINDIINETAINISKGTHNLQDFERALAAISARKFTPPQTPELEKVGRDAATVMGAVDGVNNSVNKLGNRLITLRNALRLAVVSEIYQLIAGIRQLFTGAVTSAQELHVQIGLIKAITQDANKTTADWISSLRNLSDETGRAIGEVSVAAYDALSNQIVKSTEDTEKFIKVASDLARTTGATLPEAGNILAVTLNAYSKNVNEAEKLSSQFFAAVDIGRLKLKDIGNILGRVGNTAHALSVSTGELLAALSVLTQTGLSSEDAITRLNNLLIKIYNPTKDMKELFGEMGVTSGQQLIQVKGLSGALQEFDKAIRSGSASAQKLFPEIRTLGGYFGLSGDNLEKFIKAIATTTDNMANYKGAIQEVLTPSQQFQKSIEQIKNVFTVGFGTKFIDAFNELNKIFGNRGLASAIEAVAESLWLIVKVAGAVAAAIVLVKGSLFILIDVLGAAYNAIHTFSLGSIAVTSTINPWILGIGVLTVGLVSLIEVLDLYDKHLKQVIEDQRRVAEEASKFSPVNVKANAQAQLNEALGKGYRDALGTSVQTATIRMNQAYSAMIDNQKKKTTELKEHVKSAFKELIGFLEKIKSKLESTIQDANQGLKDLNTKNMEDKLKDVGSFFEDQISVVQGLGGGQDLVAITNIRLRQFEEEKNIYDDLIRKKNEYFKAGNISEANAASAKAADLLDRQVDILRQLGVETAINQGKEGYRLPSRDFLAQEIGERKALREYEKADSQQKLKLARDTAAEELKIVLDTIAKATAAQDAAVVDRQKLLEDAVQKPGETKAAAYERAFQPIKETLRKGIADVSKIKPQIDKLGLTQEADAILANLQKQLGVFNTSENTIIRLQIEKDEFDKNSNTVIENLKKMEKAAADAKIKIDEYSTSINKLSGQMGALRAPTFDFGRATDASGMVVTSDQQPIAQGVAALSAEIAKANKDISTAPENAAESVGLLVQKLQELKAANEGAVKSLDLQQLINFYTEARTLADQYNEAVVGRKTQTGIQALGVEAARTQLQSFANTVPQILLATDEAWEKYAKNSKNWADAVVSQFGRVSGALSGTNTALGGALNAQPIGVSGGNVTFGPAAEKLDQGAAKFGLTTEQFAGVVANFNALIPQQAQVIGAQGQVANEQMQAAAAILGGGNALIAAANALMGAASGTVEGGFKYGGRVRFAKGGPSGTDTIPAWLSPGEYVMPKNATDKYYNILEAMREGSFTPQVVGMNRGFSSGGGVKSTGGSVSNTINVTVPNNTPENVARQLGREINREIRRGNIKFQ